MLIWFTSLAVSWLLKYDDQFIVLRGGQVVVVIFFLCSLLQFKPSQIYQDVKIQILNRGHFEIFYGPVWVLTWYVSSVLIASHFRSIQDNLHASPKQRDEDHGSPKCNPNTIISPSEISHIRH